MAVKKHILFFVDHKWRDLLISVYIKKLFEMRGYRVTLARNGFERFIMPAVQPDAVIFNHVYEEKRVRVIKKFIDDGLKVIILPTENIPVMDNVKRLFSGGMSDLSVVHMYFIWNSVVGEMMKDNRQFHGVVPHIIGVPRYDIYRPPLSTLIMKKEDFLRKYGLHTNMPVVTMTTNFTLAGFADKNIEFFKRDIKELKSDQVGYNHLLAQRDTRSREIFHSTFKRLVDDYKDVNFIIKPHPSEDHIPYYALIDSFKGTGAENRVAVVLTEYIWDVLNATDVLLERSCLTGLEAWFSGKPTIELRLNPDEWYHSPDMAGGSDEVKDYEALKGRINYYLSGGAITPEKLAYRERIIRLWCGNLDGRSSIRFVETADKYLKDKPPARRRFRLKELKNYLLYYIFIYPDYKLLDLKLYKNRSKKIDKLGRTDKYFNAADIKRWEAAMTPVLQSAEFKKFIEGGERV